MASADSLSLHTKPSAGVTAMRSARSDSLRVDVRTVLVVAPFRRWLPAFDLYADHVREWWPRAVSLVWCPRDQEPELAWKLVFADKSDQAGDLAYHDFTADGRPISYVFAADVEKTGDNMTV